MNRHRISSICACDGTRHDGQALVCFGRGEPMDWYVWDLGAQRRIQSYRSRRELLAARTHIDELPRVMHGMPALADIYTALRCVTTQGNGAGELT